MTHTSLKSLHGCRLGAKNSDSHVFQWVGFCPSVKVAKGTPKCKTCLYNQHRCHIYLPYNNSEDYRYRVSEIRVVRKKTREVKLIALRHTMPGGLAVITVYHNDTVAKNAARHKRKYTNVRIIGLAHSVRSSKEALNSSVFSYS